MKTRTILLPRDLFEVLEDRLGGVLESLATLPPDAFMLFSTHDRLVFQIEPPVPDPLASDTGQEPCIRCEGEQFDGFICDRCGREHHVDSAPLASSSAPQEPKP